MSQEKIKIFVTGGTIDAERIVKGKYIFGKTHVPQMLDQARVTIPISYEVLMLKYSPEVTREDRQLIYEKITKTKEDKIIVTHGTRAMIETARFLGPKIKNKTVVLTGAKVPFTKPKSDALFNLGDAIAAVQILPLGVFIVMNGRIFKWNKVKKDVKKLDFASLDE